jgi:hypothetical protein
LREILAGYGEVHLVGSYALRLMVWRDLDIHLVQPRPDRNAFFELGARVANLLKPPRMHYRDETIAATPGLPNGLYWGVYLGDERAGAWKIDLWMTEPQVFQTIRAYGEQLGARLTASARSNIMQIKSACWQHPEYRRGFSSSDIYLAVLDHNVVDVEGFWTFLRQRNRDEYAK